MQLNPDTTIPRCGSCWAKVVLARGEMIEGLMTPDQIDAMQMTPPPNLGPTPEYLQRYLDLNMAVWTCNDVMLWLDSLELQHLQPSFWRCGIDGQKLLELQMPEFETFLQCTELQTRKLWRSRMSWPRKPEWPSGDA